MRGLVSGHSPLTQKLLSTITNKHVSITAVPNRAGMFIVICATKVIPIHTDLRVSYVGRLAEVRIELRSWEGDI